MKRILFSLFLFSFFNAAHAQLVVTTGVTPTQLVNGFIGAGITVSNISLNCPPAASGTFSNGNTTNLGINNGSVLTTGSAAGVVGPNLASDFNFFDGTGYVDPDLTIIEPQATFDACILTFDIIPSCDILTIRFVFGSEEYHEFVNDVYNDAFGFFVTGSNPSGGSYSAYNIARLPNSTQVSVNNINNGKTDSCLSSGSCVNCAYFVDNCGGATIQYDGMTTVITSNLAVEPCSTYTFKIAIADAGDGLYDSGVFIDSLYCSTAIVTPSFSAVPTCTCAGTATVNPAGGNPPYAYSWNTIPVQTTQTATGLCPGDYTCTVSDQSGCLASSNSKTVNVPALSLPPSPLISVSTNGDTLFSSTNAAYTSYQWYLNGVLISGAVNTWCIDTVTGTYQVVVTASNGCENFIAMNRSLPVTLLGFDAAYRNKIVNLEWETTSEINNDYFTIEKSANAINFTTVDVVKGAGNSTSHHRYRTKDDFPLPGISYYRLKQTDFDGKYEYSRMVPVNTSEAGQLDLFLYNDKDDNMLQYLITSSAGAVNLVVTDMPGRIVMQKQAVESNGSINLSSLARGVYTLILYSNDETVVRKFVY